MENKYQIDLDIKLKKVFNVKFKQGDIDTSIIRVNLLDGGQKVNLENQNIEFRFLKPDGTIVYQDLTSGVTIIDAINGILECKLMSNTLAVSGVVKCEIFRSQPGKTLTTDYFNFMIEKSIGDSGQLSYNYISSIENKLIEINSLIEQFENTNVVTLQNQIDTVNTSLAEKALQVDLDYINTNANKRFSTGDIISTGKRNSTAQISFVSDDGRVEDYTILKPLFQEKGIPCCSAIITSKIGYSSSFLSVAQILELQNIGWEIASHSVSHVPLTTLTETQLNDELKNSKKQLEDIGCRPQFIVYPAGSKNNTVKRVSRKHYRGGFMFGQTFANTVPYSNFGLCRMSLGSYFDTPTGTYPITNTYNDYYKPMIDKAVVDGSWLVITVHPADTDTTQMGYLTQTIDYIKSLNIPVLNPSAVLDKTGNIIDAEGYSIDDSIERYFKMSCDGKVFGSNINDVVSNVPTSGTYERGDRVYSKYPNVGNVGWICVTGGTPGTWRPFGQLVLSGTEFQRPTGTVLDKGFMYFDTTYGIPIWYDGSKWVDNDGHIPKPHTGATIVRNALSTTNLVVGEQFFDTTLFKPLWVKSINPTVWVDSAGTVVS